jgi:hypothetical protein
MASSDSSRHAVSDGHIITRDDVAIAKDGRYGWKATVRGVKVLNVSVGRCDSHMRVNFNPYGLPYRNRNEEERSEWMSIQGGPFYAGRPSRDKAGRYIRRGWADARKAALESLRAELAGLVVFHCYGGCMNVKQATD